MSAYERAFAETVLGREDAPCLALWRGRVALWLILKALGLKEGDEVIVPAYTCEMVPAAIRFAGAKCVYADVGVRDFNSSADELARAVTSRTRAVLCQHTYGLPQPVRDIRRIVDDRVALIEDCCQFVCYDTAREIGATGDAAFFSMQWSKPFTTGLGGMAAFNNSELFDKAKEILAAFPCSGDRQRARSLAMQVLLYALMVRPPIRGLIARAYRWAQGAGLVRGTTTTEEYGDAMPADYLAGALNVQASLGLEQLHCWQKNVEHRSRLTALYVKRLSSLGVNCLPTKYRPAALWAVPLLVENKHEILRRAERGGLPIGTWFGRQPRHIDPRTAGHYNYQSGECARSERLFVREIHLLTAPTVTPRRAERAIELLQKYARLSSDW
ncbi:MAG: DegT/DnrJ/EryC1/StrS aminotransferase family protein [Phycisphaerae bacterium]|nr:DegT/DnrJ/EryC1/StrS aminotransferase family protein [Phycisphaerae bacterium]